MRNPLGYFWTVGRWFFLFNLFWEEAVGGMSQMGFNGLPVLEAVGDRAKMRPVEGKMYTVYSRGELQQSLGRLESKRGRILGWEF